MITTIFCLARLWLRRQYSVAGFQLEDFFVLVSWLSFLVLAINTIIATPAAYRVASEMGGREPPVSRHGGRYQTPAQDLLRQPAAPVDHPLGCQSLAAVSLLTAAETPVQHLYTVVVGHCHLHPRGNYLPSNS